MQDQVQQVISTIKPAHVYWQPYVITDVQTRIFYGNAILFINKGTGDAFVNDIYLISSGESLSLNCDQNEIDNTVYKISFSPGFVNKMQVFVKQNAGVSAAIQNMLSRGYPPLGRKQQIKNYILRKGRGDF